GIRRLNSHKPARSISSLFSTRRPPVQTYIFEGQRITVTFSAGIAASSEAGVGFSIETLISQADRRLYDAKELGRDRII
ncbi:MAG: diguanylate cyclase, partial [Chloroflexia bacterium]|nr:diguanylate cyclase [Chloroflexia bacterium]